jgi:hypothetical protein
MDEHYYHAFELIPVDKKGMKAKPVWLTGRFVDPGIQSSNFLAYDLTIVCKF